MKIMQGAFFLALLNKSRTRLAPTPTNISTNSEPLIEKNGALASPATARASSVLPVPGGPNSSTPFGIFAPRAWYLAGFCRKCLISCSSSAASSAPATSANVVFGVSLEISFALDLPKLSTREPPPCICDMNSSSRITSTAIGSRLTSRPSRTLSLVTLVSTVPSIFPADLASVISLKTRSTDRYGICALILLVEVPLKVAVVFRSRSTVCSLSSIRTLWTLPLSSWASTSDVLTGVYVCPLVNRELSAIAPMITRTIHTTGRRKKRVRSILLSSAARPVPPNRETAAWRGRRPLATAAALDLQRVHSTVHRDIAPCVTASGTRLAMRTKPHVAPYSADFRTPTYGSSRYRSR